MGDGFCHMEAILRRTCSGRSILHALLACVRGCVGAFRVDAACSSHCRHPVSQGYAGVKGVILYSRFCLVDLPFPLDAFSGR